MRKCMTGFRPALAAAAVMAVCGSAMGQFASSNVTLRSWIPLAGFPSLPANANDCWGYTSASGREYAIIGLSNAAGFVEVTDPDNPVIVASIAHTPSLWGDVKVYQGYAYFCNEAGGGVQVIDLRQIDGGVVTLVRTIPNTSTAHNVALNPQSGYLYTCGAPSDGALTAYSLADPANPAYAGRLNSVYVHDAQIVSYTEGRYAGKEIAFCCNGPVGIDVIDVTDKSNPVRLSRTTYPNLSYCHQGWLSEDRRYFYVDDELDELGHKVATTTTYVFDVSDLSAVTLINTFTTGEHAIDHNQYVHGRFLYQSNYTSGVHIWDLTVPSSPTRVGWFDTYPEEHEGDPGFTGTWSNYPYLSSGILIVSDINRGLFVLDPSAARACLDADLNHDGRVDFADYLEYLNLYDASSPEADLTGDGLVDFSDYLEFLNEYDRAC
ncbi:MAG: choice-of-anchor B family protein [Phycisphaerales bacterium]|nr:choice-of-anchor B family protein [Phycisphaerales bacterium]